jgi:hypothetical protein
MKLIGRVMKLEAERREAVTESLAERLRRARLQFQRGERQRRPESEMRASIERIRRKEAQ